MYGDMSRDWARDGKGQTTRQKQARYRAARTDDFLRQNLCLS